MTQRRNNVEGRANVKLMVARLCYSSVSGATPSAGEEGVLSGARGWFTHHLELGVPLKPLYI
jgi:hypothetical protein